MSIHPLPLIGMTIEEMTAKQLRAYIRGARRMKLLRHDRDEKENEREDEEGDKENDDVVNLHQEKKGKSSVPPVKADDLPEGVEMEEDCDDCDEDDKSSKYRKKAKK